MVPALIIALIFFSFILIKSADMVIIALRRISKSSHTGIFALSAIILALGTSLPELFIGITSAIEKSPSLALGVVLGSNIANIALVGGITALVVGKIEVHGNFLKRDVFISLIAGILPIILILDGELSRVDGLVLLAAYAAYASSFFKSRYLEIAQEHKKESFFYRFIRKFKNISGRRTKEYGRLFVGVAFLLFSADAIVKVSGALAVSAKIPVFVIGLIVLAIGTSLPELAFSIRSIEDHQPSMFFGNILGSTIANSTLILGLTSLIHPIVVDAVSEYLVAAAVFVLVFLFFWAFIKSKRQLDRKEAIVLLSLYAAFLIFELV